MPVRHSSHSFFYSLRPSHFLRSFVIGKSRGSVVCPGGKIGVCWVRELLPDFSWSYFFLPLVTRALSRLLQAISTVICIVFSAEFK